MDASTARQLVIQEGCGPDGLVVDARMGAVPTAQRMERLLAALSVVFQAIEGQEAIDRELANALYGLSFHMQGSVSSWVHAGKKLPDRFQDDEFPRLLLLVESIFEDEWMFD